MGRLDVLSDALCQFYLRWAAVGWGVGGLGGPRRRLQVRPFGLLPFPLALLALGAVLTAR